MIEKEKLQLIDALIDGSLSEADFIRLEAELLMDPELRQAYYQRQELHILLQEYVNENKTELEKPEKFPAIKKLPLPGILAGLGLAASLVLALLLIQDRSNDRVDSQAQDIAEKMASGYGVVAGTVDAEWNQAGKSDGFRTGEVIGEGRIRLLSGIAHIELFSGVALVIEGRADFEIHSPMEISVFGGKVRARVPDAALGFIVNTPDGLVRDLGTEFAVDISENESGIHVLDGEIEWTSDRHQSGKLTQGQSVSLKDQEAPTIFTADASRFIDFEEMGHRMAAAQTSRINKWMEFSQRLSGQPGLVAHYRSDAESIQSRRLVNWSDMSTGGAIVGATAATDRFGRPGHSLDFSPTGSRVRLNIDGTFGSLTLLAWVRLNSLDRWFNSLFLTDGHDLGEPHWQIMNDGRIFFSVKKYEGKKGRPDKYHFYSPSIWDSTIIGRWVMLATVYDLERNQVIHTLNGEVLSREDIPADYRVQNVRIGAASIGNWDNPVYRNDPEFAVRNLNGCLDEFALFSRALTISEIREVYLNGNP